MTATGSPRLPPPLAERLLERLLDSSPSTSFIIGDLREDYSTIRSRRPLLASAWYWWHALRIAVRVRAARRSASRHVLTSGPEAPRATQGDRMQNEVRLAVRVLRRRPVLSGAIVLTIGLAIAATTIAFAVVDGVLLEPLPYTEPDRLVTVWETAPARSMHRNVVSPANFLAWRDELRSFDRLAALVAFSVSLTGDGEPERLGAIQASAAYFSMVGATPLAGRFYTEQEDTEGGPNVVVISEGLWRRRFGAARDVVGRTLILNESPQVILGVLPEAYDFKPRFSFGSTGARDIWFPAQFPAAARSFGGRYLQVLGRLAPSVPVESARQEASLLAARLRQEFPDRQEGWDVAVVTLKTELVGDVRTTVLIVFGAVCFVLLIACANVANLLLTRAAERHQEMAVRAALGAARSRLFRQLVVESLLLALLGGGVGLVLAGWGIGALVALAPDLPRLEAIGVDGSVIGFSVIATLGAALIFGLAPAIHLAGGDLAAWLTQRRSAGRPHTHRIRGALVATQIALSFMLLVGAGLLVRSLINRLGVDVGFDPEHLFTAELQPRARQVQGARDGATVEERAAFFDQVVERVRAIPGVQAASAVSIVPLSDDGQATRFWALDRPLPDAGQFPVADVRWVHRDYHRTMGIRLVTGRLFDERDRAGGPLGVIINETGARQLWPGEPAIGKRIAMPWGDTLLADVIGVVRDVRDESPDLPITRATLYWDHRQSNGPAKMVLLARTLDRPATTAGAIRAAVASLDPDLPIYNARSMESLMGTVLARARFTTMALGSFALLALVLAALGLYGVMAYTTQQREREIGIRMALGADRTSVIRMVLRQGMAVVGVAVLIGAAGAAILSRVLRTLVFDVSPTDPSTFVGVALLLAATGLWACWLPARRASGIDPVEAIRRE